jgi:hypothetical protein
MSRRVITVQDSKILKRDGIVREPDPPLEKIIKYIPGEIVAAFLFINGIFVSLNTPESATNASSTIAASATIPASANIQWGIFFVLLLITPLYIWRVTLEPNTSLPPALGQIALGTVAFVAWVYAIGGPFVLMTNPPYEAYLGSIFVALFTLIVPLIMGK